MAPTILGSFYFDFRVGISSFKTDVGVCFIASCTSSDVESADIGVNYWPLMTSNIDPATDISAKFGRSVLDDYGSSFSVSDVFYLDDNSNDGKLIDRNKSVLFIGDSEIGSTGEARVVTADTGGFFLGSSNEDNLGEGLVLAFNASSTKYTLENEGSLDDALDGTTDEDIYFISGGILFRSTETEGGEPEEFNSVIADNSNDADSETDKTLGIYGDERSSITEIGFFVDDSSDANLIFGGSTPVDNDPDPEANEPAGNLVSGSTLTIKGSDSGDGVSPEAFRVARLMANGEFTAETDDPALDSVTWGTWGQRTDTNSKFVTIFSNGHDDTTGTQSSHENTFVVGSFEPSALDDVNQSRRYMVSPNSSSTGTNTHVLMSESDAGIENAWFDFNVSTGAVTGFYLKLCETCGTTTTTWTSETVNDVLFKDDGSIEIQFTSLDGTGLVPYSGSNTDFEGTLKGAFSKDGAGFVGAFSLTEVDGGDDQTITGALIFEATEQLNQHDLDRLDDDGLIGFALIPDVNGDSNVIDYAKGGDGNGDNVLIGSATNNRSGNAIIAANLDGDYLTSSLTDSYSASLSVTHDLIRRNGASTVSDLSFLEDTEEEGSEAVGDIDKLYWSYWESGDNKKPLFINNVERNAIPESSDLINPGNGVWVATGSPSPTGEGSTLDTYDDNEEIRRWGISTTDWFKARSNVLDTESDSDAGHDYFSVNGVAQFNFDNASADGFLDVLACVDSSCNQSDYERRWEASFSGVTFTKDQAWFDFSISGDTQASGESSVGFTSGDFAGFFAGEGAEAISAGFQFGGEDSGTAADEFISGLALFEALDRISDDELGEIADGDSDGLFGFTMFDNKLEFTRGSSDEVQDVIWGWTANPEEDEQIEGILTGVNVTTTDSLRSSVANTAISFDRETLDDSGVDFTLGFRFEDGLETIDDYDLVWGFWQDDDEDQFGIFDTYSVINQWNGIDTSGASIYVSAAPAYDGVNLRSTGEFSANSSIGGRADGTDIDAVDGSFTLNLITGGFSSNGISVCFGDDGCSTDDGQIWKIDGFDNVSLDTALERNTATMDRLSVTGTITDRVEGSDSTPGSDDDTFNGFLSGYMLKNESGNQGFVLGFNLSNPDHTAAKYEGVLGASVFERKFLTSTEDDGFTTFGLLASSSTDSDLKTGLFGGPALILDDDGNSSDDNALITARDFSATKFKDDFDSSTEGDSVFRSESAISSLADTSLNGVKFGSWDAPENGFFELHDHTTEGGINSSDAGTDAYWFTANPISSESVNLSGTLEWSGSGDILDIQGASEIKNGTSITTSSLVVKAQQEFTLTLNLTDGSYTGAFKLLTAEQVRWDFDFSGSGLDSDTVFLDFDLSTGSEDKLRETAIDELELSDGSSSLSGNLSGYFVGDNSRDGLALGFAIEADNVKLSGSDSTRVDRALAGTILLDADGCANGECVETGLSLQENTTDKHNIGWGDWDNPIEDNWVVVSPQGDGTTQIQTDDYLASVNPTPVANLTGAATYGSTIASDFIGSGSAGDVTQVVAGMNVDFNTGMIADGSLQVEVAGAQAWEIDFAGTINGGDVSLNSLGGTLMDPGGLVSSSIEANLDGVFTGNNAEAFVGGFDMVDEINALNHVNGLYTIER
ncbi:MAG: hypothetical protein ACE37N_00620 [Pseudohongiellaceae bacterium]